LEKKSTMKKWRFFRNAKNKRIKLEENLRLSVVILILDQNLYMILNSAVDSRMFSVV